MKAVHFYTSQEKFYINWLYWLDIFPEKAHSKITLAQSEMTPRRQTKLNNNKKEGFIDAKYSSGDNNKMLSKPYQEENNNEVDGLSSELQMGCIVDAVKRPPNICVETCVYDDGSGTEGSNDDEPGEDAYSDDDFEEDRSDGDDSIQMEPKPAKSETDQRHTALQPESSAKLSKSQSFASSKRNGSVAGKSGISYNYGSLSIPKTNRVNMSFTNDRLREIERTNHILLNKILSARNTKKSSIPSVAPPVVKKPVPPAAFNRKKQQRQIDHENMILLRRIQGAKSSASSIRR